VPYLQAYPLAFNEVCAAMRASARATKGRLVAALIAVAPLGACSAIPSATGSTGFAPWDAGDGSSAASVETSLADAAAVDASACRPGDVQTFVPTAYRSATGKHQDVCTPNAIDAIYEHCFDPTIATTLACDNDSVAYPACFSCILSPDDALHLGPLLEDSTGWVRPNIAGCIELSDQSSEGLACAKGVQVLASCELAACEANCPVTGYGTGSPAYVECAQQADATGCQPFVGAASCATLDAGGGPADAADSIAGCLATTFEGFYRYAVPLFCGAPPDAEGSTSDAALTAADSGGSSAAAVGAAGDAATN